MHVCLLQHACLLSAQHACLLSAQHACLLSAQHACLLSAACSPVTQGSSFHLRCSVGISSPISHATGPATHFTSRTQRGKIPQAGAAPVAAAASSAGTRLNCAGSSSEYFGAPASCSKCSKITSKQAAQSRGLFGSMYPVGLAISQSLCKVPKNIFANRQLHSS